MPETATIPDLTGWLFQHSHLGICKVTKQVGDLFSFQFVSGEKRQFRADAFRNGTLERVKLGPGARCRINGSDGVIRQRIGERLSAPINYEVFVADKGTVDIYSESELIPLAEQVASNVTDSLGYAQQGKYLLFREREALLHAYGTCLRQAGGLKALLSSRVDLRPHQAFVAGVVLQDPRRRYILADEVGLGKTIEAGIVIHDLLRQNPHARVLILCPGSLTAQWLSEMYSRFGGYIFKMLDLAAGIPNQNDLRLAILSTTKAAGKMGEVVASVKWDMVVVDEAHHLVDWPSLYDFVTPILRRTPSVLLLSAVPARHRSDEYLRLLALLEPDLYAKSEMRERFSALFDAQRKIGAGLRVLTKRIADVEAGKGRSEGIQETVDAVLNLPVIEDDKGLRDAVKASRKSGADPSEIGREVLREVADRYRVHRRILRNRRAHLIEEGRLERVERTASILPYEADGVEFEAIRMATALVVAAREGGLREELLLPFARTIHQASCDPVTLSQIVGRVASARPVTLNGRGLDFVSQGHLIGPNEWKDYQTLLCGAVRPHVAGDVLANAAAASVAWFRSRGRSRASALVKHLQSKHSEAGVGEKVLIFAGFPGVSTLLAEVLRKAFGPHALSEFHTEMSQEEKEMAVIKFRDDPKTWLLLSDESGGEGRNFQFASRLVHYDTPWHVARIEQRIGRLDRLGRDQVSPFVDSTVLVAMGSPEEGYVEVAKNAVSVFTNSISGIEFGLRDIDDAIAKASITHAPVESLREIENSIRDRAENERVRDDSDALLDEASYERRAAQRYLDLAGSTGGEVELERTFSDFFAHVAPKGVARFRDEAGNSLITFDTFKLQADAVSIPEQASGGDGRFTGTFVRKVAQRVPGRQFFQVGNPLFDAVLESLATKPTGRTYAVECSVAGHHPWRGFEFVFRVVPAPGLLEDAPSLGLRAGAVLETPPVHVFVERSGEIGAQDLIEIRRGLSKAQKGLSWHDVPTESVTGLTNREGVPWPQWLRSSEAVAASRAHAEFRTRLDFRIDEERKYIADLMRRAKSDETPEKREMLDKLKRLDEAITGWTVELDSLGFLSINDPVR